MTLLPLASLLVAAVAVVLLLPAAADLVSLVRRSRERPPRAPHASTERSERDVSRLLFLIPAHNEGQGVAETVRSVLAQRYERRHLRVVVIADNCEDDTAAVARAAGAECLERFDLARRGKPYAIVWALEQLPVSSFDGVVILDADAVIDPNYAAALAAAGPLRDRVIECYDDVRNPGDSAITRMAGVLAAGRFCGSFALKGVAGLNVPLSDGMCVGSEVLRQHPWRAFGLCEDWELYAQLTAAGVRTELVRGARLYAQETRTLRQSRSQRDRWLVGKLGVLRREGPAILGSDRIDWHQKLDAIAELAVPGPAVHLGVAVTLGVLVTLGGAPGEAVLLSALGASLLRPALYAVVGLRQDANPVRALVSFTFLPVYTCWRLVVAAASVWPARQRPWIRTARD